MTEESVIQKIDGFWEANSESESENSQEEKHHDKLTFRKLKRKILNQYDIGFDATPKVPHKKFLKSLYENK